MVDTRVDRLFADGKFVRAVMRRNFPEEWIERGKTREEEKTAKEAAAAFRARGLSPRAEPARPKDATRDLAKVLRASVKVPRQGEAGRGEAGRGAARRGAARQRRT